MEIIIDKKRLESIALIVSSYVEKRDNISLNSHIKISAKDNEIILKASDSEIGIEYKIRDCNITESGDIYINAKKLIDILKALNNADIKIKKLDKTIKITQNKTSFSLPIVNDGEFIFLENNNDKIPVLLSSAELNKGFKMILPAIDNNAISMQFNCCFIDILSDKIVFAGSDSKRVNRYIINANNQSEDKIIITKKSAIELMKLLNEEVRVYKNSNYLIIENDNFKFFTKLAMVEFLKYVEVMPKQNPTHVVTINNESFLNEIKKLSAVSSRCQIIFEQNKITFKNNILNSIDVNETNVTSELELDLNISESYETNLTNKYMMDFLNLNESDTFEFKFYSTSAPVIFESNNFLPLMSANKN